MTTEFLDCIDAGLTRARSEVGVAQELIPAIEFPSAGFDEPANVSASNFGLPTDSPRFDVNRFSSEPSEVDLALSDELPTSPVVVDKGEKTAK
jgi:hypothetical protein